VVVISKGKESGPVSDAPIAPWDLDRLAPELLEATYRELERFVDWLRSVGIEVPACWYVHPWSVHRLAAVMHWRRELGTRAREAAEWWASSWGLQGLRDAWRREDLFKHGEHHFETGRQEPTPSLDEVIRSLDDQASRRPT
jgi:hypothetical protein